jgi:cyclopropane fatty-acyl-phospholipid synthase-like methyltransferase
LTIPLAKAGYDVVGLDLSEPMVNETRKKLEKENLQADVFTGNMVDFSIDRRFSLAIIARSGFMHLLTPSDQRQALLNIKSHLVDGGVLTLNTFAPNVESQFEQIHTTENDYTFRTEYMNNEGKKERIYNAIGYDQATQIMSGNWKFETFDENGHVISTRIRPLKMRQTYKVELEYLIELCGFTILNIYGGFHNEPADGTLIWVMKK